MSEYKTTLDGVPTVLRFTFEPGEDGGRDHPSSPAYIELEEVVIDGAALAPRHFSESLLDKWDDEIMDDLVKRAAEQDAEAAWEYRQERGYP
jgi:hypothetical protein